MPGPLGNILGRILAAAGSHATATEGAGKVLTGVGPANARAYSAMLAGEIVQRTRARTQVVGRESSPEALMAEINRQRMKGSPTGADMGGTYGAAMRQRREREMDPPPVGPPKSPREEPTTTAQKVLRALATFGGVLGKVGALAIGFGVAISKVSSKTAQANMALAKWHGGIASAAAELTVDRIKRIRDLAQGTAATARAQMRAQNELEEAWQEPKKGLANAWNWTAKWLGRAATGWLNLGEYVGGGFSDEALASIRAKRKTSRLSVQTSSMIGTQWEAETLAGVPVPPYNKAPGE